MLDTGDPRFSGTLVNAGGPTTIEARLHVPGRAVPGGVSVQYPTNVREANVGRLPVNTEEIVRLQFGHDVLSILERSLEMLTLEISFVDQDGWSGTQKLRLGRSGADPSGRLRWTPRPEHSVRAPLTPPPPA